MADSSFNKFSVPLGLLDYVNPVFYTVTMVTIVRNTYDSMGLPYNVILPAGAVFSIIFGLIIPTGKVLVGLGVIKFRMPVSLVFCVNSGILVSGLMLLRFVLGLQLPILGIIAAAIITALVLIYLKRKKFNTIAVLTGAFGYVLLYISLITLAFRNGNLVPVICYGLAILLFLMLCGIGIKADLKNPKIHWILEASNGMCQMLVALGTLILFAG